MAKDSIRSMTASIMEINEILDDLTSTQNLERTLHKIVKNVSDGLGCQTCAVIWINPKTEKLVILNSIGLSWQFCKDFRQRAITPLVSELIWKGNPTLIRDVKESPDLANELRLENDFKSCYGVDLMAHLRPLGYLYVDSKEQDYFNADYQLIIQLYARIISLALLKENIVRDIQRHAEKDEHTGAFDYTVFYGRLQETVARAQRLEEDFSVALIDVVKFDQLLTSYGDEVCTELMNEIMITVYKNIRKYDSLSKFGTDEIIISMPGNNGDEALACINKLYEVITKSGYTQQDLKVDLSIGLATFPDNAKNVSGLLTATKHALIECKRKAAVHVLKADTFFT